MSEQERSDLGTIAWVDLTVEDASGLRQFYEELVGWVPEPVAMKGYEDFMMCRPDSSRQPVAGICHARGVNADLPPQWLIYIVVADLDGSVERCKELGGEILVPPKAMGKHGRFSVIRDPAGATTALFARS